VSKRKQHEALLTFARKIMASWPEGDVEGIDLQDIALETGLLHQILATESCGEGCRCAGYRDDFPLTCYRLAPFIVEKEGQP